jgi:hypothetical protein
VCGFSVQKKKKKFCEPSKNVQGFGHDALSVILDKSQGQASFNQEASVAQRLEHSSVT